MRDATSRFRSPIEQGDVEATPRANDELHAVLVTVAANSLLADSPITTARRRPHFQT